MNFKDLSTRVGVAIVGIPLILAAIYFGKLYFLALIDIILVLALKEFFNLAKCKGYQPMTWFGYLSALAISWNFYFHHTRWLSAVILAILMIGLILQMLLGKDNAIANISITIFGIFYLSLLSFFILLREIAVDSHVSYLTGAWLVVIVFASIWLCDTGAYLVGSSFGKHPLFKRVSPKKTWEGAIGGLVAAIAGCIGLKYLLMPSLLGISDCVIMGSIVGIFGQISDLIESLFKRDAGVKDSSHILPGHGGIFDRFDSPIFVVPLVYLYLIWQVFV